MVIMVIMVIILTSCCLGSTGDPDHADLGNHDHADHGEILDLMMFIQASVRFAQLPSSSFIPTSQ